MGWEMNTLRMTYRTLFFLCLASLPILSLHAQTATFTPTPTITQTPRMTETPLCGSEMTLGNSSGIPENGMSEDGVVCSPYLLNDSVTLTSMSIYISPFSAGQRVVLGIYSDKAGFPGGLVIKSDPQTVVVGWNRVDVPDIPLGPGVYYLAVQRDGLVYVGFRNGVEKAVFSVAAPFDMWPGMFGDVVFWSGGYEMMIGANFCLAPGAATYTQTCSPTNTLTPTQSMTSTPKTPTMTYTVTHTATLTMTPTVTLTPRSTETALCVSSSSFGITTGTSTVCGAAGTIYAVGFQMPEPGTITGMAVKVESTGGFGRVGIYGANATLPDGLITQSESQPLSTGWNYLDVPDVLLGAGMYFLAAQTDSKACIEKSTDLGTDELRKNAVFAEFPVVYGSPFYGYLQGKSMIAAEYCPLQAGQDTPTVTVTRTPTQTYTPSLTRTITSTRTGTPTQTETPTGTWYTATRTATKTPTATITKTVTPTQTVTPMGTWYTATNTSTPTPPGYWATLTWAPTSTVTWTPSNTQIFTCTATDSPTVTPTGSATPTPTLPVSGLGRDVLGPVPARVGETVTLYLQKPVVSAKWDIYNIAGQFVKEIQFGYEAQRWETRGMARGVYWVKADLVYADGHHETRWHKAVLQ
jgi:hypothetical protein